MTVKVESAPNMIGDNKLPNHYWVSWHNEYGIIRYDKRDKSFQISPASETIKNFKTVGGTVAVFDTFEDAKQYAEDNLPLGSILDGATINCVDIEDRLSGQVWEWEHLVNVETGKCKDEVWDDTEYTRKEMQKRGATFK
jgi:hypothetical protein